MVNIKTKREIRNDECHDVCLQTTFAGSLEGDVMVCKHDKVYVLKFDNWLCCSWHRITRLGNPVLWYRYKRACKNERKTSNE